MNITELGRRHGLSRSTLLYYHRIGLLTPSGRQQNGYRRYTSADEQRLAQICLYRQTGLPLAEIRKVIDKPRKDLSAVLERQLQQLAGEIESLRNRQRIIVGLLQNRRLLERVNIMNRETWTKLLRASGFTDIDLRRWHHDFERMDPAYHQRFLEFLCIPEDEITVIREWSREAIE